MTVTCNYRSTAVIILPGVYLPPQRNATVADDAFSLLFISIHAPREGSDDSCPICQAAAWHISIHAPREGSDHLILFSRSSAEPFQSTLPARGATLSTAKDQAEHCISIHAPREGSDDFPKAEFRRMPEFQSTLPARGATVFLDGAYEVFTISIHAPREGSD